MYRKYRELIFILLVIVASLYFTVTNQNDIGKDVELNILSSVGGTGSPKMSSDGISSLCERVDSISITPMFEVTGLPLAAIFYLHNGKVAGLKNSPEIYLYENYFYFFQLKRQEKNFYEVLDISTGVCENLNPPQNPKQIIPRYYEKGKVKITLPSPTPLLAGVFFYPYF